MSMVSHLHHLFHPVTCQSSIHTLRWKERPLQCPRCQSQVVSLKCAGKYKRPVWRPLQGQKGIDERALMASPQPSPPLVMSSK